MKTRSELSSWTPYRSREVKEKLNFARWPSNFKALMSFVFWVWVRVEWMWAAWWSSWSQLLLLMLECVSCWPVVWRERRILTIKMNERIKGTPYSRQRRTKRISLVFKTSTGHFSFDYLSTNNFSSKKIVEQITNKASWWANFELLELILMRLHVRRRVGCARQAEVGIGVGLRRHLLLLLLLTQVTRLRVKGVGIVILWCCCCLLRNIVWKCAVAVWIRTSRVCRRTKRTRRRRGCGHLSTQQMILDGCRCRCRCWLWHGCWCSAVLLLLVVMMMGAIVLLVHFSLLK